ELNLSESVFLLKPSKADADIRMRIFTPGKELPTAGHPTIGTAFLLLKELHCTPQQKNILTLQQSIGDIRVSFEESEGNYSKIMMQQPLPKFEQTFTDKLFVASLLSVKQKDIKEDFPCRIVNCGNPFLIVPIKSLQAMKQLKLNHELYYQILDEVEITGIMAFTMETTEAKVLTHSRMFAPQLGVPEDPATGSAHGPLAAYLYNYQMADMTTLKVGVQGIEMGRPARLKMQIEQTDGKISAVISTSSS
ncbi:PhzF family phenazine biosynthesis protein, partial [Marivirga lumbricoides]